MKNLVLLLIISVTVCGQQKGRPNPGSELPALRDEYIQAIKDYKASVTKLLASYEQSLKKAKAQLETTKQLREQVLVSKEQVDEPAKIVEAEKAKVEDTRRRIAAADQHP